MVHGYGGSYVGNINAIPEQGIPAVHMEDGPQGVADGAVQVTCWPSSSQVGMTWDLDLMLQWGTALGTEQRIKGTNVHLGPDINIARVPLGGRVFEMLGGEDPYLAARLAVPYIKGVQSAGVLANAKHYINNDQESSRGSVSVNVDERTNWEVYYQPFIAAVQEANVNSIMCSYNKINSTYSCENKQTLSDLKNGMGFQGFVVSDWGATHSTVASANNGLDIEMPDSNFFGAALQTAVNNGQVTQATLDGMVVRVLTGLYANGIFDNPQTGNMNANAQSDAHTALTRKLAAAGSVLLKNKNNILPIKSTVKTIAVIGDQANGPMAAGGGSGRVNPPYVVPPITGIKVRAGQNVNVQYAGSSDPNAAAALAKNSEIAIVFVATGSSEGSDRANLGLNPASQDSLIATVAAAQPNTVVVMFTAGAVLTPWANAVAGIVYSGFIGQECGNAIADILFGDYNPSARTSLTFPVNARDWWSGDAAQYPGVNLQEQYSEKLLVGYRWYEAHNITPQFAFGHGLSYTTFTYSNLRISGSVASGGVTVAVDIRNSGSVSGAEVAQLYLSYPPSAGEPPKILRGFKKVSFAAGATQTVTFTLGARDVSIWDIPTSNWKQVSGTFTVSVGASSADIRLKGTFNN
jgi:beta-glucosidase